MTTFALALGDVAIRYHLVETNSPPRYDGFGTLTLYDSEEETADRLRVVLVREEHAIWQEGRYRSGLYTYSPSEAITSGEVGEILYKTLTAKLIPCP